jgi:glycosyltransferase involved in cell wall biosynthesis
MRILHYMSRFRLADGGVVRAVLDISALLARRGHETTVLTRDAADIPAEWRSGSASGVPAAIELGGRGQPGSFLDRASLSIAEKYIEHAEVVHLHTPWDRANRQLARLCHETGTPYVLTVHGMLDDWSMSQRGFKKRLYLALGGRRLLERAMFIHCTAQAELDQAKKWFPRGRGRIIPYVVDLAPFRELPGVEPAKRSVPHANTGDPIVLFLSRVHEKKRPEVVIDAAARLRDKGIPCRTLIAGTGEESYIASLKERIARRNLEDRVFFTGLVVGVEKISLYQHAAVFVLPTSQENFGLVYTEALACGTPVVATKGTDIWQELDSSGGAIITDAEPAPTADAIASLLRDPERSREMGERGRAWVLRELDGERVIARFEQMYNECLVRDMSVSATFEGSR